MKHEIEQWKLPNVNGKEKTDQGGNNEESLRDLQNCNKRPNICVIRVLEGEEKESTGLKKYLKKVLQNPKFSSRLTIYSRG